ncbi:MAG: sulfite exporter TauE/SafE family protein, partial [Dinghuibacter sp.]|nr:sulfite exporter TauE/SafE family protein [Dinghuibacter sp.]
LYNLGRVFTYTLLGILLGFIGRGIFLTGLQQWFSIAAGLAILFSVYLMLAGKRQQSPGFIQYLYGRVQSLLSWLLKKRQMSSFFFIGAGNGLLPCGMVYIALAGALLSSGITESAVYMLFFGLGTVPAMALFSLFGLRVSLGFRNRIRKAIPFVMLLAGLLLIARGMNLGIPYISPALNPATPAVVDCH